jgi:hypothetical protein
MVTDRWKPKTRTISIREEDPTLDALLAEVASGNKRLVLEENGAIAGVLLSPLEYQRLLRSDSRTEKDLAVIDEIRAAFADVPEDELQREIDKATAAARKETLREIKAARTR